MQSIAAGNAIHQLPLSAASASAAGKGCGPSISGRLIYQSPDGEREREIERKERSEGDGIKGLRGKIWRERGRKRAGERTDQEYRRNGAERDRETERERDWKTERQRQGDSKKRNTLREGERN